MSRNKAKKSFAIIGLLLAILIIALGVEITTANIPSTLDNYSSLNNLLSTTSHKSYGGDAYTGIQQAAADASNNAAVAAIGIDRANDYLKSVAQSNYDFAKLVAFSFGCLIIAIGVFDFSIFAFKLAAIRDDRKAMKAHRHHDEHTAEISGIRNHSIDESNDNSAEEVKAPIVFIPEKIEEPIAEEVAPAQAVGDVSRVTVIRKVAR